jgi:hypothetical protein
MSSRMSAEFRSSELLLGLGFAHGAGIIATSSAVIVMNCGFADSFEIDGYAVPEPGQPDDASVEHGITTEDRGNEVSRNLDQQAGLIGL